MELNFKVNKYLLMWNLLYQASVSTEIHSLKQHLWDNYKRDYSSIYKERENIINDLDDYIPDDDTIFNIIEEDISYKKIKQETNRYRLTLLELWDNNRKKYLKELKDILKIDLCDKYNVLVVHPNLDIIDINLKDNNILIGMKINMRDKDDFITYTIYKILKAKFEAITSEEREIINTILELSITNELFSRVSNESQYNLGKKALNEIKQKIYPYWLMYLGVERASFENYMIRDNIYFDVSEIEYDEYLQSYDIYEFISYCINNKRQIFRTKNITLEDIEVI